jgi:hypothetical protein
VRLWLVICLVRDHVPQFALAHKLTAFWALIEVFFFRVAELVEISRFHFLRVQDSSAAAGANVDWRRFICNAYTATEAGRAIG